MSDRIVLQKNGWGYVYMEVKADGDFIELSPEDRDPGRLYGRPL